MAPAPKKRRKRGVVLSKSGLDRLRVALQAAEQTELDWGRLTLEKLGDRMGLDPKTISKILDGQIGLDRNTLIRCFQGVGLTLEDSDYQTPSASPSTGNVDWGDAVDTRIFFGRQRSVERLQSYLLAEDCRLVALLGLGGVGKTTLSVKVAKVIAESAHNPFDWIIWRSLRHGPTLAGVLEELLATLSPGNEVLQAVPMHTLLMGVLKQFQQRRCLLILDNWETVLQSGNGDQYAIAGQSKPEFSDYSDFLRLMGEGTHQSVVLLTSREKPDEIAILEGSHLSVRSIVLHGLDSDATYQLLKAKGLNLATAESDRLRAQYDGSPLGLKMIANAIRDLFAGDIQSFLAEDIKIFNGLRMLLNQQFDRLSDQEQQVLFWLTICRQPTAISSLSNLILGRQNPIQILETLESLQRRSLCVTVPGPPVKFTLQPVVMEYMTHRLLGDMVSSLTQPEGMTTSLNRYALSLTTVNETIHQAQKQFILRPLVHRCQEFALTPALLRKHLLMLLSQGSTETQAAYRVGNLIQLLQELNHDFRGMDFSDRWIAQVNFRTNSLHQVTFRGAHFQDCEFAKAFFAITDIGIFPDGDSFLTAHFEGQILHWDWQGKILNGFQANNSNVWSIAIHPKGHQFVSLGDDGCIHVWDLSTGQETLTLNPNAGCLYSGCFNPEGSLFYSAGEDGVVRVWNPQDGTQLTQWKAHEKRIWAIALCPAGTQLATVSDDHCAVVWEVSSQSKLHCLTGHEDWLRAVAFHPTQSILATGGCDQRICVWDLNTGTLLHAMKPHSGAIFQLGFTPQGHELISASGDRTIAVSDAITGDFIRRIQGHHSSVYAFDVDETGQIVSGGDDAQLRIWASDSGQLHRLVETHLDGISGMVNLSNEAEIAFCSVDGSVHVLNLQTWTAKEVWKSPCRLYDIAISRDGQRLALGSASTQVHLLSGQDGTYQSSYSTHASNVPAVAFHPTQSLLASGSWDHSVQIHDLVTGQVIQTFSEHYIQSLDFCPNGHRLAVGGFDCVVKLWDWKNAECLQQFVGHNQWVWFVSFSPDGQWLATASADGTCRLWDVKTGDCRHLLQGHQDWIMRPVFSPDSQTILTPSKDQTIRCWSVRTGECLKVLPDHHAWVGSVLYRPDGQTFLSGSTALTLKQWDANTFQCLNTWEGDRLYGDMDLTGTTGLTSKQQAMMLELGARRDGSMSPKL